MASPLEYKSQYIQLRCSWFDLWDYIATILDSYGVSENIIFNNNPELVEGLNLLNPVGVLLFYENVSILLLDLIRDPEENVILENLPKQVYPGSV